MRSSIIQYDPLRHYRTLLIIKSLAAQLMNVNTIILTLLTSNTECSEITEVAGQLTGQGLAYDLIKVMIVL